MPTLWVHNRWTSRFDPSLRQKLAIHGKGLQSSLSPTPEPKAAVTRSAFTTPNEADVLGKMFRLILLLEM